MFCQDKCLLNFVIVVSKICYMYVTFKISKLTEIPGFPHPGKS